MPRFTNHRVSRFFFGDIPLAVADSLGREPCRWSVDRDFARRLGWVAEITRDDGITLWVGNRTYGMTVSGYGEKWGDVTFISTLYLSPSHHLLRQAANRWLRAQGIEPHGALLAALRGRIS